MDKIVIVVQFFALLFLLNQVFSVNSFELHFDVKILFVNNLILRFYSAYAVHDSFMIKCSGVGYISKTAFKFPDLNISKEMHNIQFL